MALLTLNDRKILATLSPQRTATIGRRSQGGSLLSAYRNRRPITLIPMGSPKGTLYQPSDLPYESGSALHQTFGGDVIPNEDVGSFPMMEVNSPLDFTKTMQSQTGLQKAATGAKGLLSLASPGLAANTLIANVGRTALYPFTHDIGAERRGIQTAREVAKEYEANKYYHVPVDEEYSPLADMDMGAYGGETGGYGTSYAQGAEFGGEEGYGGTFGGPGYGGGWGGGDAASQGSAGGYGAGGWY